MRRGVALEHYSHPCGNSKGAALPSGAKICVLDQITNLCLTSENHASHHHLKILEAAKTPPVAAAGIKLNPIVAGATAANKPVLTPKPISNPVFPFFPLSPPLLLF